MAYRENDSQRRSDPVRFDLMEHIGVLSMKDSGWAREVNMVSWNGAPAKVDIREWNPEHGRMSRGITLFDDEAELLAKLLARRYGLRLTDQVYAPREPADRRFPSEEMPMPTEAVAAPAATPPAAPAAPTPVSEIVAACVAETMPQF